MDMLPQNTLEAAWCDDTSKAREIRWTRVVAWLCHCWAGCLTPAKLSSSIYSMGVSVMNYPIVVRVK